MSRAWPLLVALGVWALDQATKAWVVAALPVGTRDEVVPGLFRLVHSRNRGIAFGLFDSAGRTGQVVLTVVVVAVIGVIAVHLWRSRGALVSTVGLAAVLGGALGNLTDRLARGEVVDFLEVYLRWGGREHAWPAFNVADSAITVGAGLVILAEVLAGRKHAADSH